MYGLMLLFIGILGEIVHVIFYDIYSCFSLYETHDKRRIDCNVI